MQPQTTSSTALVSSLGRLDEMLNARIRAALDNEGLRAAWALKVDAKRHLAKVRPEDVERAAGRLLAELPQDAAVEGTSVD